ncbi:MAG: ROK family protein, partial [Planctomycetia bacterium]
MSQAHRRDCWIGFDLGGTKMMATVFDGEFRVLGSKRKKTKGREGAEAGVERLVDTIHKALAEADLPVERLAGIGVGAPGPIDLDAGVLKEAPNLGWKNVPLRDMLEARFGCPVVVSNDVDAGVYGEYRYGAGVGGRCVLGVFPGTGVGGGCVYEGRILRGRTNSCMEIGHLPATLGVEPK